MGFLTKNSTIISSVLWKESALSIYHIVLQWIATYVSASALDPVCIFFGGSTGIFTPSDMKNIAVNAPP